MPSHVIPSARSRCALFLGGLVVTKKGQFVTREGDKITIDLSEARHLMNVGTGVVVILAEDALRLASQADQYLQGLVERAEKKVAPERDPAQSKPDKDNPFPEGPPIFADPRAFKNDGS